MKVATLAPSIRVVRAASRLRTETSWLDSHHCFSYGRHYEPENTHHGLLLVCNDDLLRGGTGFGRHFHEEVEIVTWMMEGELEHRDGHGNVHVLRPGLIRRISAGTGLHHSEMNPAGWAPARYIEMWVPPDREVPPSVEVADVDEALAGGGLVPVASGIGHGHARGTGGVPLTEAPGGRGVSPRQGRREPPTSEAAKGSAVTLHQHQAVLWAARLGPRESVILPDAAHAHLFVVLGGGVLDTGSLAGAGPLEQGDSARLTAAGSPRFVAGSPGGAEILVWETG